MMDGEVEVVGLKDYKAAAATLCECFNSEELSKLLFCHIKDERKRQHAERVYFECIVHSHILKGLVTGIRRAANSEFESIAVWSLPESGNMEDFVTYFKSGFYKLSWLVGREGRDKIYDKFFQKLYDVEEQLLGAEGCYTLVYLGTISSGRGKGNVKRILQHMFHNFIDKNKRLAYLECSPPSNIPLYEKYGFTPVRRLVIKGGSHDTTPVPMHIMVRGILGEAWPLLETMRSRYNYVKPS